MLQPFERFRWSFVPRLRTLHKRYLVTQSYPRGHNHFAEVARDPILVSVYDDHGLAKTHWNAVKEDRWAAIIDLGKPEHERKLQEMTADGSKYEVYWAVVRDTADLEKRINAQFKEQMRRYIDRHTSWRIDRNATIRPNVQLIFGELYLTLKHGGQTLRVKFEEVERA